MGLFGPSKADLECSARVDTAMARQAAKRATDATKAAADARVHARIDADCNRVHNSQVWIHEDYR